MRTGKQNHFQETLWYLIASFAYPYDIRSNACSSHNSMTILYVRLLKGDQDLPCKSGGSDVPTVARRIYGEKTGEGTVIQSFSSAWSSI